MKHKAMPEIAGSVVALDDILSVSRETRDRLEIYVALVAKWQKSQNLVAPNTLPQIWRRHVADAAQVHALRPDLSRWVDLGSGAGFPGLVTAILLADRPGAVVHLVESNRGKAAFLRTVARETGSPAIVHDERIESFVRDFAESVDGVSARALASLAQLCVWTAPLVGRGAAAVFHKGQDFASELAEATLSWDLDLVEHVSKVEATGRLVEVRKIVSREMS
jgi:16S rRNA (guanine527-N7)-methyltransferase